MQRFRYATGCAWRTIRPEGGETFEKETVIDTGLHPCDGGPDRVLVQHQPRRIPLALALGADGDPQPHAERDGKSLSHGEHGDDPGRVGCVAQPGELRPDGAALDLDALAQEVEKLSEVSLCDVVAEGDRAVVGLSFDAQYQGTLTDRIEEMVREKITGIESAVIHIAVTADPTLCTEIKNLAQEVQGKPR